MRMRERNAVVRSVVVESAPRSCMVWYICNRRMFLAICQRREAGLSEEEGIGCNDACAGLVRVPKLSVWTSPDRVHGAAQQRLHVIPDRP